MENKKRKSSVRVKRRPMRKIFDLIWPVVLTKLSDSSQTAVHVSELKKIRELYIVLKDVLRTYNAPGMNTEHKVCLEKCQKIRDEWRCMWPSLCKGSKQGKKLRKIHWLFVSTICMLDFASYREQMKSHFPE